MDGHEKAEILRNLREIILKEVPDSHLFSKYGGTLYTLNPDEKKGQFCGLFSYKDHVQLAFSQGTTLDDSKNILKGKGKFRRHINIGNIQDINEIALSDLVKEAALISK